MAGRENIILLTRGISLPVGQLSEIHLRVITDAISSAWQQMVADPSSPATERQERHLNAALVSRLKIARRRRSPFGTLVREVDRGTEQHNYSGEKIELRPDICFSLTKRQEYPLIGECKIIDHDTRKDLELYKKEGIQRFVLGQYAWFANQGLMIAYVRDGTNADALRSAVGCSPQPWPSGSGRHFRTTHARHFNYIDRRPVEGVPGPIDLFHVWLR